MKFIIKTANQDTPSASWEEDYNRPECKTLDEAKSWAERTIENFNNTLRPGEKPRVFLGIIEQENDAVAQHEWTKTNLVTIIKGRKNYDEMLCLRCGVTGKRHGIGFNGVDRDKKYKAPKYASCDWKSAV